MPLTPQQIEQMLTTITQRLNQWESNAKKNSDFAAQSTVNQNSLVRVTLPDGTSQTVTLSQIMQAAQSGVFPGIKVWAAGTYAYRTAVIVGNKVYVLAESVSLPFESTDFAAELEAGNWVLSTGASGVEIVNGPTTTVIDLGDISDEVTAGNFVAYINTNGDTYDLTDTGKTYFFRFVIEGIDFLYVYDPTAAAATVGDGGYVNYGDGTGKTMLLAYLSLFYNVVIPEDPGPAVNQDNIGRTIQVSIPGAASLENLAAAINARPLFTITDTQITHFIGYQNLGGETVPLLFRWRLKGLGKGTYGVGGAIEVTWDKIDIMSSQPAYALPDPDFELAFGEIGTDNVEDVVNALSPPQTIEPPSAGITQVTATRSGQPVKWLFTGPGGTYGAGGDVSTAAMFYELADAPVAGEPSELEKITEGGKTGWRIRGFDPANYGNIGERAIDFSFQEYEGELGSTGDYSHAEGYGTHSSGANSHAEGDSTVASGTSSHAQGYLSYATGDYSHAEGMASQADGIASHAEGVDTSANGDYSHAEGIDTKANGYASHTGGVSTEADSFAETVLGCFAEKVEANNATAWDADDYVFRVGTGASGAFLADGFRVKKNGEVTAPSLDNDKIIEDKSLITKKYFQDNLPSASSNFLGRYTSLANLEAAHPTASPGNYAQVDEGVDFPVVNYNWDEQDGWVPGSSGSGATTTDELPEGTTNLYHTGARVRNTPLTGLSTATGGAITATDKVIEAFGKIQNTLTNIFSASVFGAAINALTGKTTPVDADGFAIFDSAASNAAKKLTWANLKATLKAYFDTIYIKANVRVQAAAITTMSSSTTYYIGGSNNITPTTTSRYKMFFPVNATSFRANIFLYINGSTYGSGENIQVVLHDVTTNTSHTIGNVSITGHSQGILATVNATVTAGNEFEIRLVTPSFSTSPQQVVFGGDIDFFK